MTHFVTSVCIRDWIIVDCYGLGLVVGCVHTPNPVIGTWTYVYSSGTVEVPHSSTTRLDAWSSLCDWCRFISLCNITKPTQTVSTNIQNGNTFHAFGQVSSRRSVFTLDASAKRKPVQALKPQENYETGCTSIISVSHCVNINICEIN